MKPSAEPGAHHGRLRNAKNQESPDRAQGCLTWRIGIPMIHSLNGTPNHPLLDSCKPFFVSSCPVLRRPGGTQHIGRRFRCVEPLANHQRSSKVGQWRSPGSTGSCVVQVLFPYGACQESLYQSVGQIRYSGFHCLDIFGATSDHRLAYCLDTCAMIILC